jgi:hypothetical protein
LWELSDTELLSTFGTYRKQVLLDEGYSNYAGAPKYGRKVALLPAGTPLRVERVVGHPYLFGTIFHALGQVQTETMAETVPFECTLGVNGYIGRAPWESSNVPDIRYVGAWGNKYDGTGAWFSSVHPEPASSATQPGATGP